MGHRGDPVGSQHPLEDIPRHIWGRLFGRYWRVCTRRKEFEGVLAHYREPENHPVYSYQCWDIFTLGCELLCDVSIILFLSLGRGSYGRLCTDGAIPFSMNRTSITFID